jgi:hypothetical protein
MDRIYRMRSNDECGVMSDELSAVFNPSFIIHHSSLLHPVNPVHPR